MNEPDKRRFPILGITAQDIEAHPERPRNVPWSMLAPFEENAKKNHDQSLQRLAQRGGLSPTEMVAIIEGRSGPKQVEEDKDEQKAWAQLIEYIRQHEGIAASEIEFLRWFYKNATFGTGSKESEQVAMDEMKKSFERETRKVLPRGYEIKK